MKKFIKIFSIVIVLLLASMIVLPYIFKDKIVELVKTEINKSVNAEVDFKDFSLSLFRSFPDFSFGIEGLEVINKEPFSGDTLMYVDKIFLSLDLSSVFGGEAYEIKTIKIKDPKIFVKVLPDGSASYDIALADSTDVEEVEEEDSGESSAFAMKLKRFTISNAQIVYKDMEGDMYAQIDDWDLNLRGDFTESTTDLDLNTAIQSLTYKMDGVSYLKRGKLTFDATIGADLDNFKFTFKDNKLTLNNLLLAFEGWLAMPDEDITMDMVFNAPKADFKTLLSLVPAMYISDMDGLTAEGKAGFSGFAKGTYNEESMPAFGVKMEVEKGRFQYPDLPQAVENVNVLAEVNSPSSDLDAMTIDVSKFHFEVAKNPMDIFLKLKTPMSDPNIDARFLGKFNLEDVEKFYPLDEGMELSGLFDMDVALKGKQSSLDKERYSEFKSEGRMSLSKMKYADNDMPDGVEIAKAEMNFNPRYIELSKLEMSYMKNALSANGKLSNYIDYTFGDGVLEGNLNLKADYLNIDQMLGYEEESAEETAAEPVDSAAMEPFIVPDNIDFKLNTLIGRIKYDQIDIRALYGAVHVVEGRLDLKDLNMEMLGGKLNLNGYYSTVNPEVPKVDMVMGIRNFEIAESYKSFNTIQLLAPLAKYMKGDFSTLMTFESDLDNQMNPIYNTLDASGLLKTSALEIENAPSFAKLATALKYDKLKSIKTKPAMVNFSIEDGNLSVEPFEVEVDGIPAQVAGSANIDRTVDYTMDMEIPSAKLGSAANDMIGSLKSQASKVGVDVGSTESIPVRVNIVGPANDPDVKVKVTNPTQNVQDQLEDAVKEEIKKVEDQAKEELEKKKQELLDEANKRKKQAQDSIQRVIDQKKKELEQRKKEEEEKAKKKLEEEAKKKLKKFF